MATVYYDFSAATNGAGTPASPKNTWATPGNGDVIRIKRGNTWVRATQLNLSTFTGLTFEAWANADGSDDPTPPKPIITHTAASTFAWNFQGDGIHTIRNLRFSGCTTNTNGGVIGSGIVAATSDGAQLHVYWCDFDSINYNAIRLGGTGAAAAPTFRCIGCTFDGIGEDAVYGGALRYEFAHNTVQNVSMSTETGDGVGFIDADPTLAWIHHNTIDHSSRPFKHCVIVDVTTPGAGLAIVEHNTLIGSIGNGADNSTLVNGDGKMIVRWNRMYPGRVAVNLAGADSEYYSNLIQVLDVDGTTPVVALVANGAQVQNNTFDDASQSALLIATGTSITGAVIRNNATKRGGTFYTRGSGASETLATNAFEDVTTKYTAGTSSGDVEGDLLLTTDHKPKPGSPLLGAGTHLGYTRDIERKQRPNPPAIGAYDVATMRTPE